MTPVEKDKYWKFLSLHYLTEESDDPDNSNGIIEHRQWRSKCELFNIACVIYFSWSIWRRSRFGGLASYSNLFPTGWLPFFESLSSSTAMNSFSPNIQAKFVKYKTVKYVESILQRLKLVRIVS